MTILFVSISIVIIYVIQAEIVLDNTLNTTVVSLGVTTIIKALPTNSLIVFDRADSSRRHAVLPVDQFLQDAHAAGLRTCTFTDTEAYFEHLLACEARSEETTTLILDRPSYFMLELQSRNVVHRSHLFLFFWNATRPPCTSSATHQHQRHHHHHHRRNGHHRHHSHHQPGRLRRLRLAEAVRIVLITRPRPNCLCVFYNQATSDGRGRYTFVNRYDADDLGLKSVPLLPSPSKVYRNFYGRTLLIPVIHSPPWHFVDYTNESTNPATIRVVGGRDYHLLRLLAHYMNFTVAYMDPAERTQGTTVYSDATDGTGTSTDSNAPENVSFSGGLGMVQRREADLLLGDVTITWERRRDAAEFSFFTLADSGAFATHAPKRLNEAWILVRPFRWEVWPLLVATILLSGPAFWVIIAVPFRWTVTPPAERPNPPKRRGWWRASARPPTRDPRFNYVAEMGYGLSNGVVCNRGRQRRWPATVRPAGQLKCPENLLWKCVWFSIALFLKQSCNELYAGKRAKFLTTILWLATTYVLADVYSAQLTSQLARPAREAPINTLQQLEIAMKTMGYQLYVERESSSFSTLENGTEIFRRLFNLMAVQHGSTAITATAGNGTIGDSSLVASVEEGVRLIMGGLPKVILGGRETLYFNLKRHGIHNFQLSEKLYTRYSAVAVQIGCPFIESLNEVLIHLFEGGILEKMTNAEYELMINHSKNRTTHDSVMVNDGQKTAQKNTIESKMKPINLRALQGAFIALALGSGAAAVVLLLERQSPAPVLRAVYACGHRCGRRFGRQCLHMRHVCEQLVARALAMWCK